MLNRLMLGIFIIVFSALGVSLFSNNSTVYASASSTQACESLNVNNLGQGCPDGTSSTGKNTFHTLIKKVVNALSIVVGIITVFMIILAGFQFITSGGDSNGVSKARNGLLYSIIGLLVVALSQFIVHFVLNNVGA